MRRKHLVREMPSETLIIIMHMNGLIQVKKVIQNYYLMI